MQLPVTQFSGSLPEPIGVLVGMIESSGLTLPRAVLRYSFFVDPAAVRARTPYFPECARKSRAHYPRVDRGGKGVWQGREVRVGDNARAQMAWAKYTGRGVQRGSGYGVRHIWGYPWDPVAFTAGWNLCYMPFWLGMLTEDQHPHEDVVSLLKQISWDLYFRENPVCERPPFVNDPGFDLAGVAGLETIKILKPGGGDAERTTAERTKAGGSVIECVKSIRSKRSASWSNLKKAVLALQGKRHERFGTVNVEASSKSIVRSILRETGLDLPELEKLLSEISPES